MTFAKSITFGNEKIKKIYFLVLNSAFVFKITEPSKCPDGTQEPPEDKLEEDLSPEEKRVLERKIKKILKKEEKKRLKAEGQTDGKTAAAGPSASQQALEYLTW